MTDAQAKIVALYGGPTGERQVNEGAVAALEDALEKARSGEVIGVAIVNLHADGLASRSSGGTLGRYSMIGALEALKFRVLEIIDA